MPKLGSIIDSSFAESRYEQGLASKLLVEKLGRTEAVKLRHECFKEIEKLMEGAYTFATRSKLQESLTQLKRNGDLGNGHGLPCEHLIFINLPSIDE